MKKTRVIQIIREEIEKIINEEEINEMATFYKTKGDKGAAKAALKKAKEKYKVGTALYNTLDTLEKKGEIDYLSLQKYINYLYSKGATNFYIMVYNSRFTLLNEREILKINLFCIKQVKKLNILILLLFSSIQIGSFYSF